MWEAKTETIPVIMGAALGAMPHAIKGNLKKILENLKEKTIQEIALCGTAHILRKILAQPKFEHLSLRNRVETWNKCLKIPTNKNLVVFKSDNNNNNKS